MWPLLGIVVVVIGFAVRLNPLLVIAAAAAATGAAAELSGTVAGLTPLKLLGEFGHAFASSRLVSLAFIALPVIGLLERYGLQERARMLVTRLRHATAGRLLLAYFLARQLAAATGISFGGQAQMVRPLLAPMVEGAAQAQTGAPLTPARRFWLRAHAAAAENIGVFFGEDIFIAIGSILLIKSFLESQHIVVEPFALSVWAIPTAVLAALIHGARLLWIDRTLKRTPKDSPSPPQSGGEGGVRGR